MIKSSTELIKSANESAKILVERHDCGNKSCVFIDGAINGYIEGYAEGVRDCSNQWISVEDRLPKDSMRVIVYETYITFGYYDGIDWYDVYFNEPIEVTHWIPLPEPSETK